MVVPHDVRRALHEHAAAEAPNEACGLLVLQDGTAIRYEPRPDCFFSGSIVGSTR